MLQLFSFISGASSRGARRTVMVQVDRGTLLSEGGAFIASEDSARFHLVKRRDREGKQWQAGKHVDGVYTIMTPDRNGIEPDSEGQMYFFNREPTRVLHEPKGNEPRIVMVTVLREA